MSNERLSRARRFQRTLGKLGALNDRWLTPDRPLGEIRLLREIGPDGQNVRSLRTNLGLDSGYVSRLLRSLEAAGLIIVSRNESDRRVRVAHLTAVGQAEYASLDRRSDELAESLLGRLNESQRGHLVEAMAEVERLLTAAMASKHPAQ
jgi:DNA-binding MarR family transcriptional regulator